MISYNYDHIYNKDVMCFVDTYNHTLYTNAICLNNVICYILMLYA